MIREAIDRILELQEPPITTLDGKSYWTKSQKRILEPEPNALEIHTLQGLVDYFNNEMNGTSGIQIHIFNHSKVSVIGQLYPPFLQRNIYCDAVLAINEPYPFNRFMSHEDFIINLKSKFAPHGDRDKVLAMVGTIEAGTKVKTHDNGISQQVTVKKGIRVNEELLPTELILHPYRTFPEVEQPGILCVLRTRENSGMPDCGLWEADGGKWKLTAIANIKAWLTERLPNIPIIA